MPRHQHQHQHTHDTRATADSIDYGMYNAINVPDNWEPRSKVSSDGNGSKLFEHQSGALLHMLAVQRGSPMGYAIKLEASSAGPDGRETLRERAMFSYDEATTLAEIWMDAHDATAQRNDTEEADQ